VTSGTLREGLNKSLLVIPAQAGLRRQDAGANDGVGPKGTRQEPRVIQLFSNLLKRLDDPLRC
jgi:hypothetical protein